MDSIEAEILSCPFCSFSDSDGYFLTQHVELCHPENGHSPFIPEQDGDGGSLKKVSPHAGKSSGSTDPQGGMEKYVSCPHGCGETVTNAELLNHLDFHVAEDIALEEAGAVEIEAGASEAASIEFDDDPLEDVEERLDVEFPLDPHKGRPALKIKPSQMRRLHRDSGKHSSRQNTPVLAHPDAKVATTILDGGGTRRLGRAELGPHAHEKQMPSWLRKMLETGAKVTRTNRIGPSGKLEQHEAVENETAHVIPVLMQLCQQDSSVQRAFFSNAEVRHVSKMSKEGGFCGYRNIQMLVSYIQDSQRPGHEHFPGRLPTILKLQDLIEQAWDMGFNSTGKIETGGIRGTRKYIGTPEAQALFLSLGIRCEANAFGETKEMRAFDALLVDVAEYFRQASSLEGNDKVLTTDLPPIYLQHQGHSLTIIGFEVQKNGTANLLVFDPMFKTSPAIQKLVGTTVRSSDPARLMKAYRRGPVYLQKYKDFEVLKLLPPHSSPGK